MSDMIRTTPLTAAEKKELTTLIDRLRLAGKMSGQIVLHVSAGSVTAVQPMPMLR